MQNLVAGKIGFGLGTRENQTRPNVLRAVLGESRNESRGSRAKLEECDWEMDKISVLETNLDDMSGEILGHFVETALAAGALDVFYTPIQMKKNRPGVLLHGSVRRNRRGQVQRNDFCSKRAHLACGGRWRNGANCSGSFPRLKPHLVRSP